MCSLGWEPPSQPTLIALCRQRERGLARVRGLQPARLRPAPQALPLLPVKIPQEVPEQPGPSGVSTAQATAVPQGAPQQEETATCLQNHKNKKRHVLPFGSSVLFLPLPTGLTGAFPAQQTSYRRISFSYFELANLASLLPPFLLDK